MYASFTKSYDYRDDVTGRKRSVPAGWSGDLPDDVVKRAVDGGFAQSPAIAAPSKKKAAPAKKEGAAG